MFTGFRQQCDCMKMDLFHFLNFQACILCCIPLIKFLGYSKKTGGKAIKWSRSWCCTVCCRNVLSQKMKRRAAKVKPCVDNETFLVEHGSL